MVFTQQLHGMIQQHGIVEQFKLYLDKLLLVISKDIHLFVMLMTLQMHQFYKSLMLLLMGTNNYINRYTT